MNPTEAARCLAVMRASWQKFSRDDVSTTVWMDLLLRVQPEVAHRALATLTANLDDPPTIKQWQEACRAAWADIAPRQIETRPEVVDPLSAEKAAALISGLRDALAAAPLVPRRPGRLP
jgi:hypothetical protein